MKECDRDTRGGVVVEEFDEATLFFRAARWDRTLQTIKTHEGRRGQSACSAM